MAKDAIDIFLDLDRKSQGSLGPIVELARSSESVELINLIVKISLMPDEEYSQFLEETEVFSEISNEMSE